MTRYRYNFGPTASVGSRELFNGQGFDRPFPSNGTSFGVINDSVPPYPLTLEECWDVTMAPPFTVDHPLDIVRRVSRVGRLTGRLNNYPSFGNHMDHHGHLWYNHYMPIASAPALTSDSVKKTLALANMNPGRPDFDLPLFIFELKDLPRMVKGIGDVLLASQGRKKLKKPKVSDLASDLPSAWLSWSLGWAPLIQDIISMFSIAESIENRKRYLTNLASGARVRRTIGNYSETSSPTRATLGHGWTSGSNAFVAETTVTLKRRMWYTANAELLTPLPTGTKLETLSRDLVLGMSLRPEILWNMIPWTWLTDYFINVGTYLEASNGVVPWKCTRLNVMEHISLLSVTKQVEIGAHTSLFLDGGITTSLLERKSRSVFTNPSPALGFHNFLSGSQIANVSAMNTLAAIRRMRG